MAEYEALIQGLIFALKIGIQRLPVQGDFKLVIQQINRALAVKVAALMECRTAIHKLIKSFSSIRFEYVP